MGFTMKKELLIVALSAALLSGCVISIDDDYEYGDGEHTSWSDIEQDNRQKISNLSVGTSIGEVKRKMGVPDFDELLVKNEKEHRVLYYRTQRIKGDGYTTKDECTPILFVNNELIGFGEAAIHAL